MKAATPPELTIEEKKKIWEERIKYILFFTPHVSGRGVKKNYEDAMRGVIEWGTWPIGPSPNASKDREKMQREYGEIRMSCDEHGEDVG